MRIRALLCALVLPLAAHAAATSLTFNPPAGVTARGKHVVLLSGDEEYRSEEALPMLAKILSQRHGFRCTVLFSLDPDGVINPENQRSLADSAALDSADAIVMSLRFRNWMEADMGRFVAAFNRGVPVIALRTSTHAFNIPAGAPFAQYSWNSRAPWPGGFGKHVLGETWISYWGRQKFEATCGVAEPANAADPILRGVKDVFGDSDVYEAYPPADARILMRGLVLKGMSPNDAPADHAKPRATDKQPQGVNSPAMPIAWTRVFRNEAGKENRIFTTTLGAATDLLNEGSRRLVVNAVFWSLGLEVPAAADVRFVDPFTPKPYGFKGYRYRLTPDDYALGKETPPGATPPPAPPKNAPAKKAAKQASAGGASSATATAAAPAPAAPAPVPAGKPAFQLNAGDRVAIVGNALADRMQHHGWLETMIHLKHPEHNVTVRNLAFAGDEVSNRARSKDFGTPDEWLGKVQAGVVF
ncbi:MAG: heme-binding protein, partial [Opitutaceae bacterium]